MQHRKGAVFRKSSIRSMIRQFFLEAPTQHDENSDGCAYATGDCDSSPFFLSLHMQQQGLCSVFFFLKWFVSDRAAEL